MSPGSNAGLCDSTTAEEIVEQLANPDDFRFFEQFGNVAKGNVSGNERDSNHTPGEKHGVVYCPGTHGEEFSLAGKRESDFCHSGFVDRASRDGVDFTGNCQSNGFFHRRERYPGGIRCRRSGDCISDVADYLTIDITREFFRGEGTSDNFRPDSGGISESDSDAKRHRALSWRFRSCATSGYLRSS